MEDNFIEDLRRYLKRESINAVIFGETHGFLDDSLILRKILNNFTPEIIVYEMLEETKLLTKEEKERFLREPDEKDFSVISNYGELKKIVGLANEFDIPIVGNDIKNMGRENKDFLKITSMTPEQEKFEEILLEKRENRQSAELKKLLDEGKIFLATTGAFHLRTDSPLFKIKGHYLVIFPIYGGVQLFEPPENFDVKKVSFKIMEVNNE